jgi:hypothetical protein
VDLYSYLCKYEDRSHIQTHLSPDHEESGEDPVEENVTRQLLFSLLSVFNCVSVFLLFY